MMFRVELHVNKEFEYGTFVDAPTLDGVVEKLENQERFESLNEVDREKIGESRSTPTKLFVEYEHEDNGNDGVLSISRPHTDVEGAAFMIQDLIHTPTNN